jgi:hypothetical protein
MFTNKRYVDAILNIQQLLAAQTTPQKVASASLKQQAVDCQVHRFFGWVG